MTVATHAKILVVEDDRSVRDAIVEYLSGHGFVVDSATDAVAADKLLNDRAYDLIMLDVMLPGEDGLSICRRLADKQVPILIVSAMSSTLDRIIGLELGAADYLPKPFEPRELLARIKAILRRNSRPVGDAKLAGVRFNGLRYDREAALLTDAKGVAVMLTAGDILLLEAFLVRPGRLLSRNMLLDLTHGGDAGPFDRAIDLAISRLRRKLVGAGAIDPIETVRGAGYRFTAGVEPA